MGEGGWAVRHLNCIFSPALKAQKLVGEGAMHLFQLGRAEPPLLLPRSFSVPAIQVWIGDLKQLFIQLDLTLDRNMDHLLFLAADTQ